MTPEEQRIAIAERCGWKWNDETIFAPDGGRYAKFAPAGRQLFFDVIPDYLNNLNASHEAETQFVNAPNWQRYKSTLQAIVKNSGGSEAYYCHATAAQRAEAFLKTIGKWKD